MMSEELRPYPAYKDSGVLWLGVAPEHWHVASVKRHYDIQLGKMLQNTPNDPRDTHVRYLKAQHVQWFAVRTTELPTMWASPAEVAKYCVGGGDLLVCEGGEGGRSGILRSIDGPVIIQNALHRVRSLQGCRNDFMQYVMSAVSATGWFDAINNKATIAHFTREKFGALGIPIPPVDEQSSIVRYLDHVDRRIGRFLRAKQKVIALLNEQKQAIIQQAVTRGLDPNVRLKPSGVEWLGDVPEHWEIRKLAQLAKVTNGTTPSRMQPRYWQNGTVPWLSSGKVNDYVVRTPSDLISEAALRECSLSIIPRGSVILGMIGQGKTRGLSARLEIDACINQNLAAIVPKLGLDGHFLHYMLTAFYLPIRHGGRGANQEALNCEIVASLRLPLPPLSEQMSVVGYLEDTLSSLVEAVQTTQRQISLLREYRTRLIADVVTGKVDVRRAAARLPDDGPDDEPTEAIDAGDEDDLGDAVDGSDEEADGDGEDFSATGAA